MMYTDYARATITRDARVLIEEFLLQLKLWRQGLFVCGDECSVMVSLEEKYWSFQTCRETLVRFHVSIWGSISMDFCNYSIDTILLGWNPQSLVGFS